MSFLFKIVKGFLTLIKWLWDFMGLRFVFQKIVPPFDPETGKRKPITFTLWVFGIYVAFFGVASQRYENRVDIIENRANAIFTQLATPIYKKALSQIPRVQRMPCPVKPEILNPNTVWQSLFGEDTLYTEIVDHLKETVEAWNASLDSVNLSYAILDSCFLNKANLQGAGLGRANLQGTLLGESNLQGTYLRDANLQGTLLGGSNLQGANLILADLQGADLSEAHLGSAILVEAHLEGANLLGAHLEGTLLFKAHLEGANLRGAHLEGADLTEAHLEGARLWRANLVDVTGLTIEQLCETETLYEAQIDSALMEHVKEKCPYLLEKPEWEDIMNGK